MKNQFSGVAARLMMCGAASLAALTPAAADIKYTQVMRNVDADDKAPPISSTTKYVRQGAERTETTMQAGPMKMQQITLRLCEKKQLIRMEPRLKIYTVGSDGTGAGESGNAATGDNTDNEKPAAQKPGTGKMTITTQLKDLGEEEVAGFKTRHYMISSRIQSSGCAGDLDHSTKMEIWSSDIRDAVPCENSSGYTDMMASGMAKPGCKITFEQKGDADAVSKAYRGLIMRMKIYNGDKVTMIQEVTMLSQAKLGDEPFTIPADYKQVSEQEFQQAQSRAMMQAMMEQAQKGNKNDNADEDGNKAEDEPQNDETEKNDADKEEAEPEEPKEKPKKRLKLPRLKF